jgi:sugar phosphate isomerase/epimerase
MSARIGVLVPLPAEGPVFTELLDFGLQVCQLVSWETERWTDERARQVRAEIDQHDINVTAFWAGWPGPKIWDFVQGPDTLGIVPRAYRDARVAVLKQAGDFAHAMGLPAIITHLGFIPENASDPLFAEVVDAVREIAAHIKPYGMEFWFETGQETPVTMLRLIEQVGTGNLGLNLDPANLILYGRANPVDALDTFGRYVRNLHAKDGLYPTEPMKLGREVKVGEGKVNFPVLVQRLDELGFAGEYVIEREISGAQQRKDIAATITYLRTLIAE